MFDLPFFSERFCNAIKLVQFSFWSQINRRTHSSVEKDLTRAAKCPDQRNECGARSWCEAAKETELIPLFTQMVKALET